MGLRPEFHRFRELRAALFGFPAAIQLILEFLKGVPLPVCSQFGLLGPGSRFGKLEIWPCPIQNLLDAINPGFGKLGKGGDSLGG